MAMQNTVEFLVKGDGMIENQPIAEAPAHHTRKIPIHERSVRVGDVIVVNGHGVNHTLLKQRFVEGNYHLHETTHFLLFTRAEEPKTILVPNTLQRLLTLVSSTVTSHLPDYGSLGASATLYQRVIELSVGERFLDAACNGGYFPLLLAERIPFVSEAVGVDIDAEVFKGAQELATERHLTTVRFVQADLLAEDFSAIGMFDTVTALHVLEHFTEAQMYHVMANLLKVTAHRLIAAVPYELGEPSSAYDHKQLFTQAKLEAVGMWCIEQLQGAARIWYEDIAPTGGLLLLERHPS